MLVININVVVDTDIVSEIKYLWVFYYINLSAKKKKFNQLRLDTL